MRAVKLQTHVANRDEVTTSATTQQDQEQCQPQRPVGTSVATDSRVLTTQEETLETLNVTIPEAETRGEFLFLWVATAVLFGAGIWYTQGAETAQQYFAGYLLEQSLSIDNLFVFVLVFNYFKCPVKDQPRVLSVGLITAAVLRLGIIALGSELIQNFRPLLLGFAAILVYSSYKLLFVDDDDDAEDLSDNQIVVLTKRLIPVSSAYDPDGSFFTVQNGITLATPLLLVLVTIEISDIVFAVDSIPAVFGVTLDPFVVYSSNMFAILNLRALYSFVSTVMTELRYLDKAVAVVLGFIGVKLMLEFVNVNIPTDVSLLTVGSVLGVGVGASLLNPERGPVD